MNNEPAVGVSLAQELELVRGEVDNHHTPAGPKRSRRLDHGTAGVVEVMQHLVDRDNVEALAGHRQRIDIAVTHLRIADPGAGKVGAGDGKHVVAGVDAERARILVVEKLQQAPGSDRKSVV